MVFLEHIDEVHDNDAAQVAQSELSGDFGCGFHIDFEGGAFGVFVGAIFATVDIDSDDGFGAVDDD